MSKTKSETNPPAKKTTRKRWDSGEGPVVMVRRQVGDESEPSAKSCAPERKRRIVISRRGAPLTPEASLAAVRFSGFALKQRTRASNRRLPVMIPAAVVLPARWIVHPGGQMI